MARTEIRLRTDTTPAPVATPPDDRSDGRLSSRWSLVLGGAWVAFMALTFILEPVPTEPTLAWWESLLAMVQLGALGLVASGLARRTTWAAGASLGVAGMFTATVFACPATGHHDFGLWWFGEFAAVLALAALSAVATWRTRPSR